MPVLYLTEQGSTLRKEGELFVVTKDGEILQKVPGPKVEQVVIFGNIGLTTPVIHYLLQEGTDCVFCSSYGKYHGRLFSTESRYGLLRQKQMLAIMDAAVCASVAREIVRGKMLNQRTLIMRYFRAKEIEGLADAAAGIEVCLQRLEKSSAVGTIRGLEGQSSALYYGSFKRLLRHELGFGTREKRPPTDPVNSLLSFGYTLLTYAMQSAVRAVGLDPFLGFLHVTEYSRPSLALDLIEEFRAIIVDSVVLRAINTGAMVQEDFRQEGRAVLLTQDGIKKFLGYFEERVQTQVIHPVDRTKCTYRRVFELQARRMARLVLGHDKAYQPFLVK